MKKVRECEYKHLYIRYRHLTTTVPSNTSLGKGGVRDSHLVG